MTRKEMFSEIINLATANNKTEIVEFCNKEIASLDKKITKNKEEQDKKKEERDRLGEQALEILRAEGSLRAKDIGASLGVSPQKATVVLKELIKKGLVDKTEEKRVSLYHALA